jgi:hypothetical protein
MPNKKPQPTSVEDLQNQIQLCMMQRQNMEAIFNAVAMASLLLTCNCA